MTTAIPGRISATVSTRYDEGKADTKSLKALSAERKTNRNENGEEYPSLSKLKKNYY
jgi:hypothetical protein